MPPHTIARRSARFRLAILLLVGALVSSAAGCQVIIGTLLLIQGRDKQECDFKLKTNGEKLVGKDKKVVVLCVVPDSARSEYGGLDLDIITHVTRDLQEQGVKVADSQKVASWLDSNGLNLTNVLMVDVAREFKANYIILITFEQFSFREPNSPSMYRGRARGNVSVTKIDDEQGAKYPRRIYNTVVSSTYPANQPIFADERESQTFRLEYVQRVGQEVGRLFHDYLPEEAF